MPHTADAKTPTHTFQEIYRQLLRCSEGTPTMTKLEQHCGELLAWLRAGSPPGSTYIAIPSERVAPPAPADQFVSREHYFKVRVHEMRLSHRRQWFATYDPLVLTVTGFRYDGDLRTLPFTIGPSLIKQSVSDVPGGFLFTDTTVAGLHPYQGGVLDVAVILYRLRGDHSARQLLSMVDSCARLIDFGTSFGTYVKVANVVLDGLDRVLGLKDTVPMLGHRIEFDPVDGFRPGHHVLALQGELDPDRLWVRNNRLLHGPTPDSARPVDHADYVLYSVAQEDERNDAEQLPWFRPLWKRVVHESNAGREDAWRTAKAHMAVLSQALELSPDLTRGQARQLRKQLIDDMKVLHDNAVSVHELGPADALADEVRRDSVEILDL
jgi:hypothetical protein